MALAPIAPEHSSADDVEDHADEERPHDHPTDGGRLQRRRCAVRADLGKASTDDQRREVERLVEQMRLLRENNEQVLTLARELSTGTIDKIMTQSR